MSRLLEPKEVAARLRLTKPSRVYAMIHAGTLKASNVSTGRKARWLIRESEVEAFIERRQKEVRSAASRRRAPAVKRESLYV